MNHTPRWQKLLSTLCSVVCGACNCALHQEHNVLQYRNLWKGLAGQEPGLAKPQLDPALGKPLFSCFKKGNLHQFFISFFTNEKFGILRIQRLLVNNVLRWMRPFRMDRESGMCLPVAAVVSCPTLFQGSRGMGIWTEQKLASVTCQDCPHFLAGMKTLVAHV